jgi:hypothetical protein
VRTRLPSVVAAVGQARAAAVRFPFSLGSGFVAAFAMMALIEGPEADWKPRVLATAALGLPVFTALTATAERRGSTGAIRWAAPAVALLGLVALFALSLGWTDRLAALRFAQLLLAGHLLAAVLPYARDRHLGGFWQFNRFLLLRYLVAGVYAVVLWVGLAIALAAIDQLLGIDVPDELYPELMAAIAFVFHPWFFLAGLTRDYPALDRLEEYPIALKAFTQFVLIPLVTVYLVILTLYLGRVLVTRTWPSGWIGWLVSSVSVTGVLALLLVHPVRDRADSRWVNGYGRWFFVALLPSLGMLLVAIAKRVAQYGITEPRYFLLVLALWLVALSVYYGLTASQNIKLIPVSLCAVTLGCAVGPWGAYAVSRRSQIHRLEGILAANGMGRAGAAVAATEPVSLPDQKELSAIFAYLREAHGPGAVADAFGVPRDTVLTWAFDSTGSSSYNSIETRAMERLGLQYVDRWTSVDPTHGFTIAVREPGPISVTGFDVLVPIHLNPGATVPLGVDSLVLRSGADLRTISVSRGGAVLLTLDLGAALAPAVDSLRSTRAPAQREAPILLEGSSGTVTVRLVLHQVNGRSASGGLAISGAQGLALVRRDTVPR